jgi:CRP/FNR family transcriptional regulator, dissimilatory nitrate respiration regulator
VIQGNVSIEKADYWGNRHIMTYVSAGEIFGEAYACSNDKTSNVEVVAADKCIEIN